MKKILMLLVLIVCMVGTSMAYQSTKIGDLYYCLLPDQTAEVTYEMWAHDNNYAGLEEAIIPPTVEDGEGITYTVTTISPFAFYAAHDLKRVDFPNTIDSIWSTSFTYCDQLTEVVIPDNVRFLSNGVFSLCTNLKTVTIGSGVDSIGIKTFHGCRNIETIYNYALTPQNVEDVFSGNEEYPAVDKSACTLYVPASSVDLYKEKEVWKDFKIEAIPVPEGVEEIESPQAESKNRKVIHDGQVYIFRGEKAYTLQGQEAK